MCRHNPNSYVRLLVWYRIPAPAAGGPPECDWSGGHVTLQVKDGGRFAHLGWWPSYWDLFRPPTPPSGVVPRIWRLLWKRVREWACFHGGIRTRYATKGENPASLNPGEFDSILARSVRLDPKTPRVSIKNLEEATPSEALYLCVPDVEGLLRYIDRFNARRSIYHVVFNNCATVAAKALTAGGAEAPKGVVWPARLVNHCKAKRICQSAKSAST